MIKNNKKKIKNLKKQKIPIVCISAYTKPVAKIIDQFVDIILVGDSLGTVLYGFESTREVSLDMMINHGRAVVNGSKNSIVIVDMPYGSYEKSKHLALKNAKNLLKLSGADGVKLEGGIEISKTISYLVKNNINVMGHIGMLPQKIKKIRDYKIFGRKKDDEKKIIEDALSLEKSGVFSIVIEATLKQLADKIISKIDIPTIGIGASENCLGQILVLDDIIGLTDFDAKFIKKYSNVKKNITEAIRKYSCDVREKKFPRKTNLYMPE